MPHSWEVLRIIVVVIAYYLLGSTLMHFIYTISLNMHNTLSSMFLHSIDEKTTGSAAKQQR